MSMEDDISAKEKFWLIGEIQEDLSTEFKLSHQIPVVHQDLFSDQDSTMPAQKGVRNQNLIKLISQ